jgi:hypothetical protein
LYLSSNENCEHDMQRATEDGFPTSCIGHANPLVFYCPSQRAGSRDRGWSWSSLEQKRNSCYRNCDIFNVLSVVKRGRKPEKKENEAQGLRLSKTKGPKRLKSNNLICTCSHISGCCGRRHTNHRNIFPSLR